MFTLFLIIYLLTLFLCFSSYALYPVVIWLVGKISPFRIRRADINPRISIIITAYNEEKNIERKIRNTLELEYPRDKVEILVGSDGSTDGTTEIVKSYDDQGIYLHEFNINRGKTLIQNDLVRKSKGEMLIFTDAASFLEPHAIKKIVRSFADDRIGCVAGKMRFVNTDFNLTTQSQGLYWRYEIKIRDMESKLGNLIGVDGPLYAVRRECYVPLEHDAISDLLTPLLVLEQGNKVVLDPEALVDEDPTLKTGQEFATRRRITLRGLIGIFAHIKLLNPLKHPMLAFQVFFHKVLRWFVGPLVILNGLACWALSSHLLFKSVLIVYVIFIFFALLGCVTARHGLKFKMLTVPYYFSLVNLAATMGIIDFFRGKQAVTWKPVRH